MNYIKIKILIVRSKDEKLCGHEKYVVEEYLMTRENNHKNDILLSPQLKHYEQLIFCNLYYAIKIVIYSQSKD